MLSLLVLLFSVAACGDDDDSGSGPSGDPINNPAATQSAVSAMETTNNLRSLSDDPGNQQALGGVGQLYGNYSSILGAKYAAQQQQSLTVGYLTAQGSMSQGLDAIANADWEDCYTVDGDTATYDNCESGGSTINGTITGTETSITLDIEVTSDQSGTSFNMTMEGSLEFSDTSVVGTLHFDIDGTAQGTEFNYDVTADYDVELTDGCATGGTLEIDGSWSYSGQNVEATAYITFGPTCGDAELR